MKRFWEIDAARGLMLVLMTATHVPSRLTDPLGQPFGFVSAAEGFVMLSAFVSGMVYCRIAQDKGVDAMRTAFWRRALKVYLAQAALLIFVFTVIAILGMKTDQMIVRDLLKYYFAQPHEGLLYSLLLVYQPALLDILPLYIFFMLLSPWVLAYGLRHGWGWLMALSASLWFFAQFGLSDDVYAWVSGHLGIPVPYKETGAFDMFAWQFLWFIGLWLGAGRAAVDAKPLRFPNWVLVLSAVLVLYGFYWRHYGLTGQAAFGDNYYLNLLFDKWRLGPFRLINLAALCVIAIRFGPPLLAQLPRPRWLEAMGSASLPVFCAHLVAVLLVLATFGGSQTARPWWGDVLLLIAVYGSLYAVARAVLWLERPRDSRKPAGSPTGAAPTPSDQFRTPRHIGAAARAGD